MANPLQATPFSSASGPGIDGTMLGQISLRPSPYVQGTSMEGETVLLDLSTGRYFALNPLGSVVWEQCTGDKTISEIHTVLCERFEVVPGEPSTISSSW